MKANSQLTNLKWWNFKKNQIKKEQKKKHELTY
jgi:hypothetical protein